MNASIGRISKVLIVGLFVSLLVLSFGQSAEAKKLVLADKGWDSIQVHNRIAGFILKNGYGYDEIEYIPGETIAMMQGLARGDVDIDMEIWVENQQEAFDKFIAAGKVLDLGANFPDSWQGWLVPTFVIKGDASRGIDPMAPDLKSVEDMKKYWELFKDPEDKSKGRFYSCIPGWECSKINEKKFAAYGLDETYNIFMPGSDAALSGSLAAAYEKGKPWFGYYWAPTWVLGKYDMTPLEEPPYNEADWEKGLCGYPSVKVNIAVNSGLMEKAPEVVEFLKKYESTQAQANKFLAFMRDNKADTQQAAEWFLKNFEDVWTAWVPADVVGKVKSALK